MTVAIATSLISPSPSRSETLFVEALNRSGVEAVCGPWNGDQALFERARLVLLRACWDYHQSPREFLAWIDRLEAASIPVLNHPDIVRWNFEKSYVFALEAAGVTVPRSAVVDLDDPANLAAAMDRLGLELAVLKPISGQSGVNVVQVRRDSLDAVDLSAFSTERGLVQSFEADIERHGETVLVFFEGVYSHAARRVLPSGEWRANANVGATYEPADPTQAIIDQASRALACSPMRPLYGRVDGIVRGDAFMVLELELIEPGLYLDTHPGAAERFCDAVRERLTNSL